MSRITSWARRNPTAAIFTTAALVTAAVLAAVLATNTTPNRGGTYTSADDLITALAAHGHPCVDSSAVTDPSQPGAQTLDTCFANPDSDVNDTTATVFDTRADAMAAAHRLAASGLLGAGDRLLAGGNWLSGFRGGRAGDARW